ncbi:hypothetical protein [Aphanizomenon sp. UHCC 0183]|uniref:nSTAND1 domain-containing NTPase n=1 Tax=Aphanizomenon sp. UHCC 0183 TaxID=2590028 RepID=UPI00144634F0|nr:hypothetical protein [Aphanizomenon sp. UHCC 0183]MTJ28514.1 hypothetical protein [Aphanizomenon sp. UHCC 0183]
MFLFYHSQQSVTNAHNYKGQLFEQLMSRYLDATGYDIKLNQKKHSLEYDLEGVHRISKFKVLGEAKAQKQKQGENPFTHFCGKYIPQKMRDPQLSGLFLSISRITKESEDYYNSLSDFNFYDIKVYTGKELFEKVRKELKLPEPYTLAKQIEDRGLFPLSCNILATDNGIFMVQFVATSKSTGASLFALFRENGTLLSDQNYSRSLKEHISELSGLDPIIDDHSQFTQQIDKDNHIIRKGLSLSQSWTDYRLPAAPEFFVGRQTLVDRINEHLELKNKSNIIEIKSRSGVGKSSFIAYINSKFEKKGHILELHDARNIKSIIHLFSVIQRFTDSPSTPCDMREVEQQIQSLAGKLTNNQFAIFMIDQFESTFSNSDLFDAYENLIQIFAELRSNIFLFIARKSDVLTTYDDKKIDLGIINQLSHSYELQDLSPSEAAELINKISENSIKPLHNELKAYVYEYAQGFPWLIKRTMDHIVHWLEKNRVIQGDFFDSGLGLDDLFNEELEGLDEIERDYLTKMAQYLPANRQQLERLFDEDPFLSKVIHKLVDSRLLRVEGSTYDIYNDVFKDFLVHKKQPELRRAFIYRLYPKQVINAFHTLINNFGYNKQLSDNDLKLLFQNKDKKSHTIKELCNVGLLKKYNDLWIIPKSVQDVSEQNNLGDYVRQNLINNTLITDIMRRTTEKGYFSLSESYLLTYLQERFIFTKANEKTWNQYANILKKWMIEFYLIEEIKKDNHLISPTIDRKEITKRLGNLESLNNKTNIFLPTQRWSEFESVAIQLLNPENDKRSLKLIDLNKLSMISHETPKFESIEELRQVVIDSLIQDPYTQIWSSVSEGKSLVSIMQNILQSDFTESTIKRRLRILLDWGQNLGIIPAKKYKY